MNFKINNTNDQYDDDKRDESLNQSQKFQLLIRDEQNSESKIITDQIKFAKGMFSQDVRSPQNALQLLQLRTSKIGSMQTQMQQNYLNEQTDFMDQIDEPNENPLQNPDYVKIASKVLSKFNRQSNNESTYPVQQPIVQDSLKETSSKQFETLKFNDIVYLKFKHENKKEIERQELRSYLVITNARNQLECVSEQVQSLDNPVANFRRCLFQILNPRQALEIQKLGSVSNGQTANPQNSTSQKKLLGVLKQSQIGVQFNDKKNKNKTNDENTNLSRSDEEGEGEQLIYGKQIMLYHQYTKMFLTFNPQKPAKQNGCIQCTLEKYPNSFSIFRMLPNDYSRRVGDKIFDSDVINIQEIKKCQFFLNVSINNKIFKDQFTQQYNYQYNESQIYASEEQTKFKVKCYMNSDSQDQNVQQYDDGIAFKTGDIIKIQHLDSGAFLSASEKKFSKYSLTCRVQNAADDTLQTGHNDTLQIRGLEQHKISHPENFTLLYDSENPNSSYAFWEIQRKDHYTGGDLYSDECFRLKNLATGLFLTQDGLKSGKLQLTQNGKDEDCYFLIKKDKSFNERKKIYQQDTFKIYNLERKYIAANQIEKGRFEISLSKKISGVSLPYLHAFNTTEKHVVDFLEQALQIYNTLLQFHFYLQSFAIAVDKQKKPNNSEKTNEEIICFSYQEACLQQKTLESEQQYVYRALNELENLLMKDSYDSSFSLQVKQQFLREQKVLELLVLIARLIDVMSHGNRSSQGSKDKSKLARHQVRVMNEKSPMYIVRKHLQQLPIKIYNILYLGTKQNPHWSSYIFENDDLLSGQLRHYPKEVGALLKEAIKNLENFKNENSSGDEITEWVKLLDPLDENKPNISDQIFFIEFISLAVIDPNQRPLQVYQNKCTNELFSKKDGRAIIQFHEYPNANGVYISFNHGSSFNEFIQNNKPLSNLGYESNKRDRYGFSLEKMSRDSIDIKSLQPYIKYISSVMTLLANLCYGRNKKSIHIIKDTLGINENHIFNALRNIDMHKSIKTSLLQLYEVIFLDDEPFQSLSKAENRSYVWNEIEKKSFSIKTSEIFKQIQDLGDNSKSIKQFDQRILPILIDYWQKGIPEYDKDKNYQSKQQTINLTKEEKIEIEEKGRAQLQFLLSFMKVTRSAMDLGQFTPDKIELIVNSAVQTLYVFVGFNASKNLFQQDHWIKRYISKAITYGDFDQELEALIIEVSKLLRLYLRIKLNLQINYLLQKFYQEYTNLKNRKKAIQLKEDHQQIIQDFTINMKPISFTSPKDSKKRKLENLNSIAPAIQAGNKIQDDAAFPLNKNEGSAGGSSRNLGSQNNFDEQNINNNNNNLQVGLSLLEKKKEESEKKDNPFENEALNAQKIENIILIFLLSKVFY